jgi:hypothetical protein
MLGSTGVVTFIVLLVLAMRTDMSRRAAIGLGIFVLALVGLAILASKLGLINWVTNLITGQGRTTAKVWHQGSGYSLTEIRLGEHHALLGKPIKEIGDGVQVLFLERADGIYAKPSPDDVLRAGDCLVCYGPSESLLTSGTSA